MKVVCEACVLEIVCMDITCMVIRVSVPLAENY